MSKYIGTPVVSLSTDTVDVTGDITTTDATPEVIIVNDTHEDTDGGREGKVTFKGQQSGGEETTLAEIQASHDGTSDDEKGDLIFKTNDGSDGASPTERLRIDSAGGVGINGAASTGNALTITGNSGYDDVMQLTAVGTNIGARINLTNTGTGVARINATNNSLALQTGGTERARIDSSSGTLQIGSSTNAGYGPLQIGSTSLAAPTIQFLSTTTGNNTIHFGDATSGAGRYAGYLNYRHNGDSFEIATAGGERMRILSGGQLMVGLTAQMSGGDQGIELDGGTGSIITGKESSNARTHISFVNPNGTVGSITTTNSATAFNTSSDYRLKENVTDISDGITRVKQLAPKRFNFIADADTTVDGFIAHEAATVVPEAIYGTKDEVEVWKDGDELPDGVSVGDNKLDNDGKTIPVMQAIDQSKIAPLLTAALQEAIAKIETLETKVAALEGE